MNPDDAAMLAGVDARAHATVSRAVKWCSIPSGSDDADGLGRMLDVLETAFRPVADTLERLPLAGRMEIDAKGVERQFPGGHALLLRRRPELRRRALLTGHFDTVYQRGSTFDRVRTREDGALTGPGIADMKGGLSVMLAALEAFEDHPLSGELGWDVLLSPDEEVGSPGSAPILARLARQAEVGLTYEPALPDGALVSARMGSGNYHLVVTGRSTHVGRDFAAGRNAIVAAARLAARLDDLNGSRGGVRLNVGRLDGGGPSNVVPDAAVLRFNVRVAEAEDAGWLEQRIAGILADPLPEGVGTRLVGGVTRAPKPVTASQRSLFGFVEGVGAELGRAISWRPSGGVCEGNNLLAAGLPSVDTLGVRGGDIHSDREFAWPGSFPEAAALSALILVRWAGLPQTGT